MTKPLLSELVTPPSHDLLTIACRAVTPDADGNLVVNDVGATVLADAVVEMGWHNDAVMMLLLGVPLEASANPYKPGSKSHTHWARDRRDSIVAVQSYRDVYRNVRRPTAWAKATLAVMLFGGWPRSQRVVGERGVMTTRSPFPLIRRWARRLAAEWRGVRNRSELALERDVT